MNVAPLKVMNTCNKRQNDCQKGQPICLTCLGFCITTSEFAFVPPITMCFGNYVVESLGLSIFSSVYSLAVQLMANVSGMNLCAIAFGNMISIWRRGRKLVSQMMLPNQFLLTLHCHYMLIWSLMVSNKSCLPVSLSEGQ